jgi:predicted lysophospholipase L1 biosynthesis ABC-type transport system permease subunit
MPIGIARQAEPDPGFSFDGLVLGAGCLAVAVSVVALGALGAWRALRVAPVAAGASWSTSVTSRLARAGLGPAPLSGVRLALTTGRGRTAVPVRAALVGTSVGLAGVVAVVVFGASLTQLLDTPERYGWTWDVTVDVPEPAESGRVNEREFAADLGVDPDVDALAVSRASDMQIEGNPVQVTSVEPKRGTIEPAVVDGNVPRVLNTAVLGSDTLDRIDRSIGDTVEITGPAGSGMFEIVGRGVFPTSPVADGVYLTPDDYRRLGGDESPDETSALLVRWAPGIDGTAAAARLQAETSANLPDGVQVVNGPAPPAEVDKLDQLEALPLVLAAFLALLAVLGVAYALATAVRRRRQDFAILETLGFVRRQVSATVAWQASTTAAIGLVIGVPVGVVVGRLAW